MRASLFSRVSVFITFAFAASVVAQIQGPSSSQSPYLIPAPSSGVQIISIFTTGDSVNTAPDGTNYRMVGAPDGLGAFFHANEGIDNDSNSQGHGGRFTLLMNHEILGTAGNVHAHGSAGAFVSQWTIDRDTLKVVEGHDLIQQTYLWNPQLNSYEQNTTAFTRFCSATLADQSAFYDPLSETGTRRRLFLGGEENGPLGRAFGHIATGPNAGQSFELPRLGKVSFENAVANPATGRGTLVATTDDFAPNGEVHFYLGTKQSSGNELDQAGLTNGNLYGVKVDGLPLETNSTTLASGTRFGLVNHGDVSSISGAQLQAQDDANAVTKFLRPEDGQWDPQHPADFYFATTNSFTAPSRLYRLRFDDINNPAAGGKIDMLLDGTEGIHSLDNMTIDRRGHVLIQEDPGANAYLSKVWQYDIASDTLKLIAEHDPDRFLVGGSAFLTIDEESSGIIDASDILGSGWFLLDVQAHYANGTELVEGGQLLALYNPDSDGRTVGAAVPEPASLVLLLPVAFCLGLRRRGDYDAGHENALHHRADPVC